MHYPPPDAILFRRYIKIRAHAERGEGHERINSQRMMEKMEQENPGLRAYADAQIARESPRGRAPQQPDWSNVAGQAADFINSVFRDIQREAEKQRARQAAQGDEDDEDSDAEEMIDDLVDITTTVTKTGKVTVKVEISAAAVEEMLEAYDDPEDLWEVFQGVGARVATELADALDPDEDDDED